jgi:hypothetical protein
MFGVRLEPLGKNESKFTPYSGRNVISEKAPVAEAFVGVMVNFRFVGL